MSKEDNLATKIKNILELSKQLHINTRFAPELHLTVHDDGWQAYIETIDNKRVSQYHYLDNVQDSLEDAIDSLEEELKTYNTDLLSRIKDILKRYVTTTLRIVK